MGMGTDGVGMGTGVIEMGGDGKNKLSPCSSLVLMKISSTAQEL